MRKKLNLIIVLLFLITNLGCGSNAGIDSSLLSDNTNNPSHIPDPVPSIPRASPGCNISHTPGTFSQNLMVNGQNRIYKIIIPANYDPETPYALTFGFHGSAYSNTTDTIISQTQQLRAESNNQGIFVYPDERINNTPAHWVEDETGRDVAFFDALLENLKNKYCIDENHVFAVGFSDGGGFVNTLACHRSDKIAGGAEASGWLPEKNLCTSVSTPMFIWHGKNDTITDFVTYGQPRIDHWKDLNGCTDAIVSIEPFSDACVSYVGCTNKPLITCTPNQNHGFPSSIAQAMWNFLISL